MNLNCEAFVVLLLEHKALSKVSIRAIKTIGLANFRDWALDLLQQVLPFDGAIWAIGHIETQEFHTQTIMDRISVAETSGTWEADPMIIIARAG